MLFQGTLSALDGGDVLGTLYDLAHSVLILGTLDHLHQTLVLGRKQEERIAKQSIGTRGEDGDLALVALDGVALGIAKGEVYFGALGTANPVCLHLLDALGPTGKLLQVVKELLCVRGDLDVPLLEIALFHLGIATPATALGHLFVSKYRLALGAPIDRVLLAIDQSALPKLLKNPLAPAIVIGAAGLDQAIHIIGKAHALHRGERLIHILIGPSRSLGIVLDSGVLGGQAKGVKTDGMQYVKATHAGLARHGVTNGVVARMAHVQVAGRVREHLEHVLLGLSRIGINGKKVLVVPGLHPFFLNGFRIVGRNLFLMICAIAHIDSF